MLDAGLISYRELQPWAESLLASISDPPQWLCDVAIQKYSPDVSKSLGDYVWSQPFESFDYSEADDEHLASLYVRYERRELSWATFLDLAGRYADNADRGWVCEEFYELLNDFEDAEFSPAVERKQQETIRFKLQAAIGRVRPLYDDLRRRRRSER